MSHKHFCLTCGDVIAEGEFDCEQDRDHDYADCDDCANEATASTEEIVSWAGGIRQNMEESA